MDLSFSELIPFETLKDNSDRYPDLDKGGIYVAYAVSEIDGSITPENLLYIGKAEYPSNNLGKRIKEHDTAPTGKTYSDHGRWRQNKYLDRFQKIAYCYAPMDDMSNIEDIEKKLIWLNKPCANSDNKNRDNSSVNCPTINIILPFTSRLQGYQNTLDTYLNNIKS